MAGVVGPPSSDRTWWSVKRHIRTISRQKSKDFGGVAFALVEVAMFTIRVSCSILSLIVAPGVSVSVCADGGSGVGR